MDMRNDNQYQQPMQPLTELKSFAKSIEIFNGELELFVYQAGRDHASNLVMIHGLGDEADTWRHIIDPLAEKHNILAVDLPGFGRSPLPDHKITPPFLLDCLKVLLEETGLERSILMGNSLGAILTHAFALKHPRFVEGLILVDGALLQDEPMGDFSLRLMQIPLLGEWLYKRLRKDPQAAFDSLRNVYHDLDCLPQSDRDFLFRRVNQRVWSEKQRKAYFSTLRNLTPWVKDYQTKFPKALENLNTPTLVIRGEHDGLFSENSAKSVAQVQPNASFLTVQEAGHLPHQEQPHAFLSIIDQWMGKTIKK